MGAVGLVFASLRGWNPGVGRLHWDGTSTHPRLLRFPSAGSQQQRPLGSSLPAAAWPLRPRPPSPQPPHLRDSRGRGRACSTHTGGRATGRGSVLCRDTAGSHTSLFGRSLPWRSETGRMRGSLWWWHSSPGARLGGSLRAKVRMVSYRR